MPVPFAIAPSSKSMVDNSNGFVRALIVSSPTLSTFDSREFSLSVVVVTTPVTVPLPVTKSAVV